MVDFSVDKAFKEGLILSEINFKELINQLITNRFSGFIALTIEGVGGIEEGTLIMKNGDFFGSKYSFFKLTFL